MRPRFAAFVALLPIVLALPSPARAQTAPADGRALVGGSGLSVRVTASKPRINRRATGSVLGWVRGVPAEPIDSFVWDGVGSEPASGLLRLTVDPLLDAGRVEASWRDANGQWTFRQVLFMTPEHVAGVRVGSSTADRMHLHEAIVHNTFAFGDTGAGPATLPTLFSHVTTWGPAEILLDGAPFHNPFDGGAPWSAQVVVGEGAREPDGTVRAIGGGPFDPSRPDRGRVEIGDLEVQLMFHDRGGAATSNVPAEFRFFYNVVFEEVAIDLLQFERAGGPVPVVGRAPSLPSSSAGSAVASPTRYRVTARSPRRNRRPMGPPIVSVQGVPAEPVDSFVWNGVGSDPIEGELILEVLPDLELGVIQATWTDEHGDWLYFQGRFIHPEHSSGVRIGSSVGSIVSLLNEGITNNVYLHGDTTAGQPILPTVFNHLAAWGPADVLLDGQPFLNPFELPAPQWLGHLMLTEGVRDEDGTVRTTDGGIYNPARLLDGAVQPGDLEVHLVFHDERFPRNTNIPPLFAFFYHLVFEDVSVQIVQEE